MPGQGHAERALSTVSPRQEVTVRGFPVQGGVLHTVTVAASWPVSVSGFRLLGREWLSRARAGNRPRPTSVLLACAFFG